jgi:hypothetical protein
VSLDKELIIYCDRCDYTFSATRREAIEQWHNENCPECHSPKIINDYDKRLIEEVVFLEERQERLKDTLVGGDSRKIEVKTKRDSTGNSHLKVTTKD